MTELRVIIAGGRDFDDYILLKNKAREIIDSLKENLSCENIVIVSGKAKGADSLGERFALEMGYKVKQFPAEWDKWGKRAGYMRNSEMAHYVSDDKNSKSILIALWDSQSRGTKHMIETAERLNIQTFIVNY